MHSTSPSRTCHLQLVGDAYRPLRRRQVGEWRMAPKGAGGACRVTHGAWGPRRQGGIAQCTFSH